jgi:head-tail adaptor
MTGEMAGALKERIAIGVAGASDAAGAVGDPVFGEPVWASIESEAPVTAARGERLAAPARYTIVMRGEASAKVGDRLQWRGETLTVIAVTRDPLRPDRILLRAEARR